MYQTLNDYINDTLKKIERENSYIAPVQQKDIYEVYPEDDNTDTPKNPYSQT